VVLPKPCDPVVTDGLVFITSLLVDEVDDEGS
jgi:hypothetical protein